MHLKHWGHHSCVGFRKHLLQLVYCIYMIRGSLSFLLYCFSRADRCFSKIWNICCDCKSSDSFVLRLWKKKHKHKLRQQLADVLWQLSGGSAKNICFFKEGRFSPVKRSILSHLTLSICGFKAPPASTRSPACHQFCELSFIIFVELHSFVSWEWNQLRGKLLGTVSTWWHARKRSRSPPRFNGTGLSVCERLVCLSGL